MFGGEPTNHKAPRDHVMDNKDLRLLLQGYVGKGSGWNDYKNYRLLSRQDLIYITSSAEELNYFLESIYFIYL